MFFATTLAHAAAVIGVTAVLALGASPALADSSGAQVESQKGCQTYPDATVCYSLRHVETNLTTTRSGNTSYESNGKYDYTVTFNDGHNFTESGSFHEHKLAKPGTTQEWSRHVSDVFTTPGYVTCTYSGDIHFAGGHFQFDNTSFVCTYF